MSNVRKQDRSTSTIEFLKQLRDLEAYLLMFNNKCPKKFRTNIDKHMIDHVAQAYTSAKIGNSIFPQTQQEYQSRKLYIKKAYAEMQAVVSQIEVFYHVYRSDLFSNSEFEHLCNASEEIIILLRGTMKSDAKRFKDLD